MEFELQSFKIEPLNVDCRYRTAETDDMGVTVENDYHVKISRIIHPDLSRYFDDELKRIAGRMLTGKYGEPELNIVPNGIYFCGKEERKGVAISGEIVTGYGGSKFRTPRVRYLISDSPVSAELTAVLPQLIEEIRLYIIDGKTAELDGFEV